MQIEIARPQALKMIYPSLGKMDKLKRQVEIDEAKEELGFNRYVTFPYTPRDDRKKTPASLWAFISQFSI